jgi:hypothetical protein
MEITGLPRWAIQDYIVRARNSRKKLLALVDTKKIDWKSIDETFVPKSDDMISFYLGRWTLAATIVVWREKEALTFPVKDFDKFIETTKRKVKEVAK